MIEELLMQFIDTQIIMNIIYSITDVLIIIFLIITYQRLNRIENI